MSPDPGGVAAVDPSNPQTWNRYAYVMNNPVNAIDPLGLKRPYPAGGGGDWLGNNGTGWAGLDAMSIPVYGEGFGWIPWDSSDPSLNWSQGNPGQPNAYFGWGWTQIGTLADLSNPISSAPGGVGTAANNGTKPCSASAGSTSIVSGNVTTNVPTIAAGAFIGEWIGGPPGAFLGGIIGSFFGVGGTASYVPSTNSLYAGPTVVFAPALGGGNGFSGNVVSAPASQNPNSIANGLSFSVSFQPTPLLGSTVVKSPGSGQPVVGPSVGTRVPVSFGGSFNFPVKKGGC